MSDWPPASSFASMLQNPPVAFKDRNLKKCKIKRDAKNLPVGMSGQFAVVYQAQFQNGKKAAVRIFTTNRSELKERYKKISEHVSKHLHLPSLVEFDYVEKGVRASNGRWYPILKMDWVEGTTLYEWVAEKCRSGAKADLARAAKLWIDLVAGLRESKIAHGDLQHGNVMVTPQGDLKLVDYDCMCVPDLEGEPTFELGVEPYQHPSRDGKTRLSRDLDNFSALFIYVALRALASAPELWQQHVDHDNYDKLLFRVEDFRAPQQSTIYQKLRKSADEEVARLTEVLFDLYNRSVGEVRLLSDYLFSWEMVEKAFGQGRFDDALDLAQRSGQTAPANLQSELKKAQERVQCRLKLTEQVRQGNELGMTQWYKPQLLDDYPAAQEEVRIARQAKEVLASQQKIEAAKKGKDFRQAVKLWDQHKQRFGDRISSKKISPGLEELRGLNQQCDRVLAALNHAQGDADGIWQEFQTLQRKGGHPDLPQSKAKEVEKLVERLRIWPAIDDALREAQLHPVPQNDLTLVRLCESHQAVLAGWPQAVEAQQEARAATQRLADYEVICKDTERFKASQSVQLAGKIRQAIALLPEGYQREVDNGVNDYLERHNASESLRNLLRLKAAEAKSIVAAADVVKRLNGESSLTAIERQTVQLARERLPLINKVHEIPLGLPLDERDQRLQAVWVPRLLEDCREVEDWRAAYLEAIERKGALDTLERAIGDKDPAAIYKAKSIPLLAGYPLPDAWRRSIVDAEAQIGDAQRLADCLKSNDREGFVKGFDYRLIRQYSDIFADQRDRLEAWLHEAILKCETLRLDQPVGLGGLVAANGGFQARWQFPHARFTDHCLLALCRTQQHLKEDPRKQPEGVVPVRLPIEREDYRRHSGGRHFRPARNYTGYYVAVWAVIDLGDLGSYVSEPLLLGQIPSNQQQPRQQPRSPWRIL